MESLAAWVFTIVSALGAIVSWLLLVDAQRDREALKRMSHTNGRVAIVRSSLRYQTIKLVVFLLFLVAGLSSAVATIEVAPSIPRLLLVTGVLLLMVNSFLEYKTKKRLLSG